MEGHVRQSLLLVLALAALLSLPAGAQVAGRWKITLDNDHGTTVGGELILASPNDASGSRVLLESRDSAWIPIRDSRVNDAGSVTFSVAAGDPLQFEGALSGDELKGTVAVRGEQRYRWRGVRLRADEEFYGALPRFRQLQIRIEPAHPIIILPGRWLAAAAALGETAESVRSGYIELSLRAGLVPLPPDSLTRFGLFRAMGLFRRNEMAQSARVTLEKIRANLRNDTAALRFDLLFRPGGRWQFDIHDVALSRARRPYPTLSWESVEPALAAAGLIERDRGGIDAVPLALYRLFVQSSNDSTAFRVAQQKLRQADAAAAAAVTALVSSYGEASEWYASALRFLLEQRWIPATGGGTRSPADLVRDVWRVAAPVPEVRSRLFGYPEGAVRIGTDSMLANLLITPENAPGRDWLHRHGTEKLMATLHQLSVPYDKRTGLRVAGTVFRLSSVQEYARESFSGFLEPRDIILVDPSYQPLLALGTVIHEWQHILHERARQTDRQNGAYRLTGDQLALTLLDPFVAEGFAEWLTEVILAPALTDFPLLGFGESEKRVSLPQNDPHQLGYLMARALARTVGTVEATMSLLVRSASDPQLVLQDPRVRRAWAAHRSADRTLARRNEPTLLPLAVFTIEDGAPDLVQSEVIAPYIPPP